MMLWTQLFIWVCIGMWRELLCLLFCPRAWEMRVNRLLTSLGGPRGPAHSTATVPYSGRWPVEVAVHSQTTLAWPPMSLFLLRIWNQLPSCIFELVFSLKEWAGHTTPAEYCRSHTTVEWQFRELKANVWLSELSLSLWKQTQKLLDKALKLVQYHV